MHPTHHNHLPSKPRRVRGGVRLVARQFPLTLDWAGKRWLDAIAPSATEQAMQEGFDYARAGQTRSLTIEPGRATALVQGRAIRAYRVVIQIETFTDDESRRVIAALAEQAIFGARLLAGEVPDNIEELFGSLNLALFPRGPADVTHVCTAPNESPWCKHACCAALLIAEAIEKEPSLIFTLRGMPIDELLEHLRDARASQSAESATGASARAGLGAMPASDPLDAHIEDFWDAGPRLAEIETPIRPPEVSHPLLRRLGPSPFPEGKFPLVGLLATCYDTISRAALEGFADRASGRAAEDPSAFDDDENAGGP